MALGAIAAPAALQAYRAALSGGAVPVAQAGGFGQALNSALQGVVEQSQQAESQSRSAIAGQGNLLDVVSAISKAELLLQTTVAVRDRVVQAYQDIMHMAI
jgi:flagellar hook-basal body complex protein FliE